jgi:hypothetical protein
MIIDFDPILDRSWANRSTRYGDQGANLHMGPDYYAAEVRDSGFMAALVSNKSEALVSDDCICSEYLSRLQ